MAAALGTPLCPYLHLSGSSEGSPSASQSVPRHPESVPSAPRDTPEAARDPPKLPETTPKGSRTLPRPPRGAPDGPRDASSAPKVAQTVAGDVIPSTRHSFSMRYVLLSNLSPSNQLPSNRSQIYESLGTRNGPAECAERLNKVLL